MADMIVSGAEYSAANGTYVESGSDGGKPRYVHESNSDYVIFWHNLDALWYVFDTTNFTWGYYSLSQVATPDLCSNWERRFNLRVLRSHRHCRLIIPKPDFTERYKRIECEQPCFSGVFVRHG